MCVALFTFKFQDAYLAPTHLLALSAPTPYATDPQLLLIPPSKDDRSPDVIGGPTLESNNRLSTSVEANTRTGFVSRTEIQHRNPHPPASNGDNSNPRGRFIPPGHTAREEGYESQRENTFDAPPAYQPQRGSAGGPRTSILRPSLDFLDSPT